MLTPFFHVFGGRLSVLKPLGCRRAQSGVDGCANLAGCPVLPIHISFGWRGVAPLRSCVLGFRVLHCIHVLTSLLDAWTSAQFVSSPAFIHLHSRALSKDWHIETLVQLHTQCLPPRHPLACDNWFYIIFTKQAIGSVEGNDFAVWSSWLQLCRSGGVESREGLAHMSIWCLARKPHALKHEVQPANALADVCMDVGVSPVSPGSLSSSHILLQTMGNPSICVRLSTVPTVPLCCPRWPNLSCDESLTTHWKSSKNFTSWLSISNCKHFINVKREHTSVY